MPVKDLVDTDGNRITVLDVDGYYLPNFQVPNQERDFKLMVDNWQARDDDVIFCNYPKSGTHWIFEIINMLYSQSAEFSTAPKEEYMMEKISKDQYDTMASPRILNAHVTFSRLPKDFIKRKCKIIYSIRNPKDLAVSYYHHHCKLIPYGYQGTWDSYLRLRFLTGNVDYHSWFDCVLDWNKAIEENKDYPIHVVQYEDMHLDCTGEIKRLAEFLNLKCDDKLAQDIAEKCQFDVMKKAKETNYYSKVMREGGTMYRQGTVGRWKDTFTVAQNELFEKIYKEKIANCPIKFKFTI